MVRYATPVARMLEIVAQAHGVAVIAHPWARGSRHVLDEAVIGQLAAAGLDGLEVDHQAHTPADRAALREIAAVHDLVVTGGSDYHGLGKVDHDLGCNLTTVESYERLVAAAGRRGAAWVA